MPMGIYDRDYMRNGHERQNSVKPKKPVTDAKADPGMVFRSQLMVLLGGMVAIVIILRFPFPPMFKFALVLGVITAAIWGVVTAPRRCGLKTSQRDGWLCESSDEYDAAIAHYEHALSLNPKSTALKVRLLSAYYGAGHNQDAREFIRQHRFSQFTADEAEEWARLVANYPER